MRTKALLATCVLAGLSGMLLAMRSPATPAPATPAAATGFGVDPVHSSVVFRVNHLGVTPFYGRFNDVSGTFAFDEEEPTASSIDIEVQAASVDTNSEKRDTHLRSPDFFNAKQFPTISFKSTSISAGDGGTYSVTGDLTLLGITKQVTVQVEHTGDREVGGQFGHRAGFETIFTIDRTDFDMTYMVDNGLLGDEVKLFIAMEGTAQD